MYGIKFFSNIKIQKQLFSILLLLFSVPVLTIGLLLVISSERNMTQRYTEQVLTENARVKSILFDLTTNIYNVSENFILNSELNELLSRQYKDEEEVRKYLDQYKSISKTLSQQTSIYEMKIYTNNSSISNYNHFIYCDENIRQTKWYQALSNNQSILWETSKRSQHGKIYYDLTMYRTIPLPLTKDFAILAITVSDNYLKNRMDNNFILSMASVNQEPVFYNNKQLSDAYTMMAPIDYGQLYYQFSGKLNWENDTCIASVSTLQPYRSDDYIYIFSYSKDAVSYINRLTTIYLFIVLLALFIPCFLLYFYTRYFSARISLLRSAMHQASQDDYNIINFFKGNDELSETFDDLLLMIKKIQQKEAAVYQSRLREQQLINKHQQLENKQQQIEFKILTSQINPHFLYNTLETIRMKAFNEDNFEVANAIKLLGRYLHYALESMGSTATTLSKELYYVEMYLAIQKIRFKDRVNYTLSIEPNLDTSQYQVLPFLLQPIIENAVLHGLEGMEGNGQITIKIYTIQDTFLCIHIHDNGEGMTPEELESLCRTIQIKDLSKTRSIGLYNINQRITLCYGPEYGMKIQSEKGVGTLILLTLPLERIN